MAQFNAPFSPASEVMFGPSMIGGTPSVFQYAELLIESIPSIYSLSINNVLAEHVNDTRKKLKHDEEYSDLSDYYDVEGTHDGDYGIELELGFFGVPDNLKDLVSRLEYGDANHPARAFVRRTAYKQFEDIVKDVSTKVNVAIGTEADYA